MINERTWPLAVGSLQVDTTYAPFLHWMRSLALVQRQRHGVDGWARA